MTQAEARSRLISAAFARLRHDGIHISVNHLSFEELIRESGVPRSTAYRIWGSKEEFFDAVLASIPSASAAERDQSSTWSLAAKAIESMQAGLSTPAGRRAILMETMRVAASHHLDSVTSTQEWRNWIGLAVGLGSLPAAVRDQITAELRVQELGRIEAMAAFYGRVATVLGLRMKPEFGDDFRILTIAAGAFMDGLGVLRSVLPAESEQRFTVTGKEWSIASIGYAAVFDRFVEVDPDWPGFSR